MTSLNFTPVVGRGYAKDQHGKLHFSIHPRVYLGHNAPSYGCTEKPKRKSGHLAKAMKLRDIRRTDFAKNPPTGGIGEGVRPGDEHGCRVPGSMRID